VYSSRLLGNVYLVVRQEIIKDERRRYIQIRGVMDKGPDLVRHCDDELSQSSPDNFSLPHVFLLHAQSKCLSRPCGIKSKLRTRVNRWLEDICILGNEDFIICRGRSLRRILRLFIGRCRNVDFRWDEQCPVFSQGGEELYSSRARHSWARR
jgi:hypothetical protein